MPDIEDRGPSHPSAQKPGWEPVRPTKPPAPDPLRRSTRQGRDIRPIDPRTHERIGEQPKEEDKSWLRDFIPRIGRIGHDEDHPTEDQVRDADPTIAQEWAKAREIERAKLRDYGVYTVVQLPEGIRPVDTKWVYDVKRDNEGNLLRRRARKVGRGFTQEHGVNYGETYSQMARAETWKVFIVLALQNGWDIRQFDVKAAYLNAPLSHEVYVQDQKEDGSGIEYWKLHKALYGLKQAGHEWYNMMVTIMEKSGLTQCIGDPGCFKGPAMISTHVDDMIAIGPPEKLTQVENAIEQHVELDKMGLPKKLLGMELSWEKGKVLLTQTRSIENLAKEHEIVTPQKSLPLNPKGFEKEDQDDKLPPDQLKVYQSLVGSLLYINRYTRPEISVHINLLGRRTSDASPNNLATAKQVLRYCNGAPTPSWTERVPGLPNGLVG